MHFIFVFLLQHLEDEILFKNQEINEFQSEIKIRDAKICNLEQSIQYSKSSEDIKVKSVYSPIIKKAKIYIFR